MATSQYLAFGTGVGANVLTPVSYAASALLPIGHQPGVALSEVANTTWRQTSVAAAALAQMSVDLAAVDMLDDGNVTNFKNGVIAAIQQLVQQQQFWQPGDVKGTLGTDVPTGWLVANGQAVSRVTYAALFAAIGTTYGAGDGSTTFGIPDLRGEFLRGWDDGRGVDSGRALGSAQAQALQLHGHPYFTAANNGNTDVQGGLATEFEGTKRVQPAYTGTPEQMSDQSRLIGGFGGAETRPRNIAVRWLIKT